MIGNIVVQRPIASLKELSVLGISLQDKETLDWFQKRTITKVPGTYRSRFWSTLLCQASITEPAVMHAVLALGAAHRGAILSVLPNPFMVSSSHRLKRDSYRHYIAAIETLRSLQSTKAASTLRVVLITCMAFFSLEALRGHTNAAQNHILSGRALLREAQWVTENIEPTGHISKGSTTINTWLFDGYRRAYFMTQLFRCLFLNISDSQHRCPVWVRIPDSFPSFTVAWTHLQRLMTTCLASKGVKEPDSQNQLYREKSRVVRSDLQKWYDAYLASRATFFSQAPPSMTTRAYSLLLLNYNLALLLANPQCEDNDRKVFIKRTEAFRDAMAQMDILWRFCKEDQRGSSGRPCIDIASSILDVGCIHVIFYVGVHCRIHAIRDRAVWMLNRIRHREGYWDGWMTSVVAAKIIALEDEDRSYAEDDSEAGNGQYEESVSDRSRRRVREFNVRLQGDPVVTIVLRCKQGEAAGAEWTTHLHDVAGNIWSTAIAESN